MKRFLTLTTALLLFVGSATAQQAKYVFLFIGDGMGINHVHGTELYNAAVHKDMPNEGRLSFTRFPVRSYVASHSASSLVTDSSAAGTALASGVKTVNGYMGVDAEKKSVKNIAELAAELGMMTGVATNVGINHATPSAFYAHNESRENYGDLFKQLLDSPIDFAAGSTILYKKKEGLLPKDYVERAKAAGMKVLQDPIAAGKVRGKRVMLLSDSLERKALRYATDCTEKDPTIVDFTAAAIKYLERESKDNGFFLMVEAGHIDYCAHDNDAVTTFEEVNHLSESVQLALDFYAKHPTETLIIVTADHETGGMTLGYDHYKMNFERLAGQKCSLESLTRQMQYMRKCGKTSWEDMTTLLREQLGFWECVKLRSKDEMELRKTFDKNFLKDGDKVVSLYSSNEKMASVAVKILNKRAYIKWIDLAHTGMPVPLFVKGVGYERFLECYDNTDVPKMIAEAMGAKLEN